MGFGVARMEDPDVCAYECRIEHSNLLPFVDPQPDLDPARDT